MRPANQSYFEEPPWPESEEAKRANGHKVIPLPGTEAKRPLTWHPLSMIEKRAIIFADKPLLQESAFHLFVGRKGVGKGTYLADIAARVTRGELGEKRNVLWIGSEDSNAIDVRPRLEAAEGDPARVWVVTEGWLRLPDHIDFLAEKAKELGDVGLLVIDPVSNHIGSANSNNEAETRAAIAPLNALADELDTITIGVRHLSEKECSAGVLSAILGSSAWVQTPRAVIALVRDDEDSDLVHVQCIAGNRLPPDTPGRVFRIEGTVLPGFETEVTRAHWEGDSSKDVEQLLITPKKTSKSGAARELILDVLEEAPEQKMESDELDALVAGKTGLTARTVQNIRVQLKDAGLVKAVPEKDPDGIVLRWLVRRTAAPRGL